MERLLADLGHPEQRLPPVIHIAGTNGKGSTVAFLSAICAAAGLKVHAYTSPHLVRFNERIVLAGAPIGDEDLATILQDCEAANEGQLITFFEITTAAALLAFSRRPADVLLLETGLGGRFDATNVIARPLLTAITPISMDHMHYLGETLAEIAFEKAGIIKPDVPCIAGPQPPQASEVIAARAAEVGAPLSLSGRDWHIAEGANGFDVEDARGRVSLPLPALAGRHQIDNAALAAACLRALPILAVNDGDIGNGIAEAIWPARLQRLDGGALSARVPAGWELWLDGAHNAAAAEALAAFVGGWTDRPLYLVLGMMATRDSGAFLRPLAAYLAGVWTVSIPNVESTATAEGCAAAAHTLGLAAAPSVGVPEAIDEIVSAAAGPARILICGSLYLAGHVLTIDGE